MGSKEKEQLKNSASLAGGPEGIFCLLKYHWFVSDSGMGKIFFHLWMEKITEQLRLARASGECLFQHPCSQQGSWNRLLMTVLHFEYP